MKPKKKFTIEKKLIAQIRFFEELYVIRDDKGETIFTGSEELAKKFHKFLNIQKAGKK